MTRSPDVYSDRAEAGRVLASELNDYAGLDIVVLGLPRGGVPVAAEVATALNAPLDLVVVRKLGLPGQPELAMAAIADAGGTVEMVRNDAVLAHFDVPAAAFDQVYQAELSELRRRDLTYRQGRPGVQIRDRVVIIVDDGLATGSTMRAAVAAVRRQRPERVIVAVPVGATQTCASLRDDVDDLRCPWKPSRFFAVGQAYRNFAPTGDAEVRRLLLGRY